MKINALLNSLKYYHAWSGDGGCHCSAHSRVSAWMTAIVRAFNESDIVYKVSDTREKFIPLYY